LIESKQLIEVIPLPFFKVNRDGVIQNVSEPTFDMFPQSRNFLDLVDLGSRKKARTLIFNNPELPVRIELNLVTTRKSAQLFDVVVSTDQGQKALDIICLLKYQDLTSLDQKILHLENQAFELSELLGERERELATTINAMKELSLKYDNLSSVKRLAASVAHEIRNPLTTVRGFMQLMKPLLEGSGKSSYADVAIDEIDRANKIIYEFLNTSKSPTLKKEFMSLHNVIKDIVMLCQSEAVLSNVELTFDTSSKDVLVWMDVKQIKQVLLNLIQNALQAIGETPQKRPGKINIQTSISSDTVSVLVEDNGQGMTEEVLHNLFKPFYTTKEEGNGIGLAVCSEIIKGHNGTIRVESKPGQGSTFLIRLPIHHPDPNVEDVL
jgi:signal transduction histidine kinase